MLQFLLDIVVELAIAAAAAAGVVVEATFVEGLHLLLLLELLKRLLLLREGLHLLLLLELLKRLPLLREGTVGGSYCCCLNFCCRVMWYKLLQLLLL